MITQLIPIALAYIMFTLGLGLKFRDFLYIQQHPGVFLIGLFNQLILVPIVFLLAVWLLDPAPAIAFGLMLISFCPGGVTSNLFTRMANANVALSIALTGVVSLLSVLTLPILTTAAYQFFFQNTIATVSIAGLGIKLFILTTIPVIIGMTLRHFIPAVVERSQRLIANSATLIFVLILIATIIVQHQTLIRVFSDIGMVLPVISAVLLIVSMLTTRLLHLPAADTITIAIESSVQNGSVGMAVATLIAVEQVLPEYALPSLLYGLLMNIIVIPFVILVGRRQHQVHSVV
ncbi:MAG: bile acid:sodium symporter [Gammaproteobacteria bacterium]|nr:MAG: bile acid:sodium symporter [Gammaproteobacteria bacterium]